MYLLNAPSLIEMQISFFILSVFYLRNHILTSVDTTYKKKFSYHCRNASLKELLTLVIEELSNETR